MNIKIKKYGWQHDLPDKRDFLFSQFVKVGVLPSKVDLRKSCSTVENQGNLGSCTANALVGNLEFLEIKNDMTFINLSRLFVYYNERVVENTVDFDSGATLRGGIKTLKKLGVCNEKICPYIISKFTQKPDKQAYQDGKNHQIQIYMRLTAINQMKQCLADGFPFVFGFSVYESFESGSVKKTGTVNLPKPDERVIGGHAVMAVEYDNKIKRFIVRNSWGIKWGMKGYFTMPYEYLADRNLSDDFWTIRKGENV
jgi:C1A family cysteine protease